ncbi:hypothetical protein J4711_13870 [Staphylococcus epidermidis]|nr:hypothetical protein [Staphylococcus epidermidis]
MAPVPDIVLATDEHGVVFLPTTMVALPPAGAPLPHDQQEVLDTHQYADQALQPLSYRIHRQPAGAGWLAFASQPD